MATSFPRSPRVTSGGPISSAQLEGLADAFNSRIRSGIGDPTWRIVFYILGMVRQIRNPSADGWLWPPNAEFFEVYQMLNPAIADWPVAEPGDPEGCNLSSVLPFYVWGNEAASLYDESTRLSDPAYGGVPLDPPAGPEPEATRLWRLGQQQRGAFDPDTGALASPSFQAARSFAVIRYSRTSPHGNAYGGFLPTPTVLGEFCQDPDPDDDYAAPINYQIMFKATAAGLAAGYSDKTYPGTCQPVPGDPPVTYAGHVAAILYAPWAYYVLTNPATYGDPYVVEELSTSYYIEGDTEDGYTGAPQLSKTPGAQLERALDWFTRDFRGALDDHIPAPAPGSPVAGDPLRTWLSGAFDVQRFVSSQYLLAPARGHQSGGSIIAEYCVFRTGAAPAGAVLNCSGDTWLEVHSGCVLAGCHASATGLQADCTVDAIAEDGSTIGSVQIGPGTPAATVWFDDPPAAGSKVQFRARNQVLPAGATIALECAELYDYKPQRWDLFLVLRLAGAVMA